MRNSKMQNIANKQSDIHLLFLFILIIINFVIKYNMDAHLNIDTIKENRNFKGITQEDTKELIDTLYAFSVLSYEAYTKKNTQYGEF